MHCTSIFRINSPKYHLRIELFRVNPDIIILFKITVVNIQMVIKFVKFFKTKRTDIVQYFCKHQFFYNSLKLFVFLVNKRQHNDY